MDIVSKDDFYVLLPHQGGPCHRTLLSELPKASITACSDDRGGIWMKVPLEISFRGVTKTEALEGLIIKKAGKLEQFFPDLVSCRVAVDRPQQHQKSGSSFRLTIAMGVPAGKELAVRRESGEGDLHDNLEKVIHEAFAAAKRRLEKAVEQQRREVKRHPEQETSALVLRIFPDEGYGFIQALDGREVYFHRNSVLNNDFDRLEIGTGVRFVEEEGEKGPQASTVQIVDKPGARTPKSGRRGAAPSPDNL